MLNILIIVVAVILLVGLLYFEKNGNQKGKLPTKTILSCLFIFTALVQTHPTPVYFYLMLMGLIFCLGGDVFLALPQERMFLLGLVSFLLGHVLYVVCFFLCGRCQPMDYDRLPGGTACQRPGFLVAATASGLYADAGYSIRHRHNHYGYRSLDRAG